nr:MAG TPA: hypothetical protein [Caudoviricetes sp.]
MWRSKLDIINPSVRIKSDRGEFFKIFLSQHQTKLVYSLIFYQTAYKAIRHIVQCCFKSYLLS